ncbi:DNA polymerase III subunit delta [Methylomonas sp. LL1]|uniref:DNA polymerase III subunit delta n=1 Tax=Methylomonas sp. LL1 TaxID=2785785 RepID=UPI0018C38945|nr:DNA polymerase III subunit delta [Methylomonas sp. LL1]QPK65125.1 DNA polymerase III subunit delta [Methylomonas sp. LL1]
MRVKPDQLETTLKNGLQPVYLISGDEPLQLGEAADAIRFAARQADYSVREVIGIEQGNEWPQLALEADSLSIFAEKKLIDLRLPSAKPGAEGAKALIQYCQHLPAETILLITAGKLDSAAQKSQWFQAIDHAGTVVQVWPLQGQDLLNWLQRRAERKGMRLEPDAVKSLAARIEGNLLAAAQEIEKLYILHGQAKIGKALIEDAVADSARFDVFKLMDALLAGKLNRAVKILNGLKAEGIASAVVLWALSRETRVLLNIKAELKQGTHQEAVFKKYQIWDKRKQLVQDAIRRLTIAKLQSVLEASADADQQIKGQLSGDSWESLFLICLKFCQPAPAK